MAYFEKGIDVSRWNGKIDFKKVKEAGYAFVIIKAGGSDAGFYTDPRFEENYIGAVKAGLKVGAYYFVGNKFWGAENGKVDAERFYKIIKGKKFDYPICLDVEAQNRSHKKDITEAAIAFCDYLEKKNYFVTIYGSEFSTFAEMVYKNQLERFSMWVANYTFKPTTVKNMHIWQCSSTTRINGHNCNFDKNISYIDFSTIIKKKGLNNYGNTKRSNKAD